MQCLCLPSHSYPASFMQAVIALWMTVGSAPRRASGWMGGFAHQLTGRRLNLLGFKESHGAAVQDDFQNADDDGARAQSRHGSRRARYVADIDEVETSQGQEAPADNQGERNDENREILIQGMLSHALRPRSK
jgi:hypothetical protein